jgi:hypothetical protein
MLKIYKPKEKETSSKEEVSHPIIFHPIILSRKEIHLQATSKKQILQDLLHCYQEEE